MFPKSVSGTSQNLLLTSGIKCDKFVADDNEPTQTKTDPPLEDVYQREQGKVRQKGGCPAEECRMEGGVPEAGERVGGVMDQKVANEKLQKAVRELGEYFDAVQIFATWVEDGGTRTGTLGCGNWYSREGMVREWVQTNEARVWFHESKSS